MGASRYSVSFRVQHPSMDPQDITTALGWEPRRAWKAGEPRTTPKGKTLTGTNLNTYWYTVLSRGDAPPFKLAVELDRLLDELAARREFLHRVRAEGGSSEFFIGWFLQSQAGETFQHSTLAKMADLHIDLALDTYAPDPPGADE
jgi:hypothetical protein